MKNKTLKVLVIGDETRLDEFQKLDLQSAEVTLHDITMLPLGGFLGEELIGVLEAGFEVPELDDFDVVFDLVLDDYQENYERYIASPHLIVFGSTAKTTLAELASTFFPENTPNIFGINALPTFIDRPLLEVSCMPGGDFDAAADVLDRLGLKHAFVKDQIGFISARVVCMIINEAYFVLGEGTADQNAVDHAMKLGVNYPMGPFEWGKKIGLMEVKEILDALHDNTNDSRYKVAPALSQAAHLERALLS